MHYEDSAPNLGEKFEELRKERNLSVREVAQATGLSESFLYKLEADETSPSLNSLWKLLGFYRISMPELVRAPIEIPRILFTDEDTRFFESECCGYRYTYLSHRIPHLRNLTELRKEKRRSTWMDLCPLLFEVEPGASTEPHAHPPGQEFLFILSGDLEFRLGSRKPKRMTKYSFAHFDSVEEHNIANIGSDKATYIVVHSFYATGDSVFEDITRFPALHKTGFQVYWLTNRQLLMSPYVAHIEPGNNSKSYRHPSSIEEFLYVLEGRLELHYSGQKLEVLEKGHGAHFDSRVEHFVENTGETEGKYLSVHLTSLVYRA